MTRTLALSVSRDLTAQAELINELAMSIKRLNEQAKVNSDPQIRRTIADMANQLNRLIDKTDRVGKRILDAA